MDSKRQQPPYGGRAMVASVVGCWYRVTLEVLLRFLVRQHVDLFVARATQISGTAFDTITRQIFFAFPVLMPRVRLR